MLKKTDKSHSLRLLIWPGLCGLMFLLLFGCSPNNTETSDNLPVIDTIIVSPGFILPGGVVGMSGIAKDPDNSPLTYHWETYTRAGIFSDTSSPTTNFLVSDRLKSGMSVKITLKVTDGGPSVTKDRWIVIDSGNTISGHVYFPKTKIPIAGVILTAFTRIDTTEADGYYALENIPNGDYILMATRANFDNYESPLALTGSITKDVFMPGDSLLANLTGSVTTVEGWFLKGVRVSIINPDDSRGELSTLTGTDGEYTLTDVPFGIQRVMIDSSDQSDYKIFSETCPITISEKNASLDIMAKIGRVVFESDSTSFTYLWNTAAEPGYDSWSIDTVHKCLSYDFCLIHDFGIAKTKDFIDIPDDVGAVYWTIEADLTKAATEANLIIYGTSYWIGSIGSGTNHIVMDEPIDLELKYMANSSLKIELLAFPQRPGECGYVRLHKLSLYIFQ
jgi:hypothetical protein